MPHSLLHPRLWQSSGLLHMICYRPRGGGFRARGGDITESVKLCSTHFGDAYLKDSDTSKKYLQSDKWVKDAGGKFAIEKK